MYSPYQNAPLPPPQYPPYAAGTENPSPIRVDHDSLADCVTPPPYPQSNFSTPYPQNPIYPPPPLVGGNAGFIPGTSSVSYPGTFSYPNKYQVDTSDRRSNPCVRCAVIAYSGCALLIFALFVFMFGVLFTNNKLTFNIVGLETSGISSPSDDSIGAQMNLNFTVRNGNLHAVTLTDLLAMGSFKNGGPVLADGVLHNVQISQNVNLHLTMPVTWKWSSSDSASMTHLKQTIKQCGLTNSDKIDKGDGNSYWKFVAKSKVAGISVTINATQEAKFPCPFPSDVNNAFLSKVIADLNSGS